jgi:hypothetical protein
MRRLLHGTNLEEGPNEDRTLKAIDDKDYKNYTPNWPGTEIQNLKKFEEYAKYESNEATKFDENLSSD